MKSGLYDIEFSMVCKMISARMGLEFSKGRRGMLNRNLTLAGVEFGYKDLREFINWLLSVELNKSQIKILASYLTISETYFWRETNVFNALTDIVLPELIASKRNKEKNIRIWSAGCSTGEEPYSLAIALLKTIPNIKDWNIRILATDINPKALEKAVSGIYGRWSFRDSPSWLKTNYFNYLGDENYQVIPEIRKMVTFSNLNLVDDVFPSLINDTYSMDIIFCRNVLMYFSEEWVSKISQNLYNSLAKDSWFVVSSCELSSKVFPKFMAVNFQDAILYRKCDKEMTLTDTAKSVFQPVVHSPLIFDKVSGKTVVHNSFMNSIPSEDSSMFVSSPAKDSFIDQIVDTEVIFESVPAVDSILKIRLLANQGHLQEALLLCNEDIIADKLSIGLYSLRASILQELDLPSEAIISLKQAIYIDPNFIMGHFALGNLCFRDKPNYAKRYFNNVLELIKNSENDEIVNNSDGLSVKYIKDITLTNLQNLK